MWAAYGSLSVVPWMLFAQASWTTDAVPLITPAQPEVFVSGAVHDHGRLFSDDAKRRSHVALRRIQRDHRVPVVIETFGSLEGRAIDDVARRRPRPLSDDGIYILLVGEERDVAVRLFRDESDGRRTDAGAGRHPRGVPRATPGGRRRRVARTGHPVGRDDGRGLGRVRAEVRSGHRHFCDEPFGPPGHRPGHSPSGEVSGRIEPAPQSRRRGRDVLAHRVGYGPRAPG